MLGFLDDLARAARTLRRAPKFTLACAAILGVGIGAATTIFSVADPVLLRPLPYPEPERLFAVWERDDDGSRSNLGFATIADVRSQARAFENVSAIGGWGPTLVRDGAASSLTGLRVSANYFSTIGVRPALGRTFTADEDRPDRTVVVVISHAFWQTRFGGDRAVVGSIAPDRRTRACRSSASCPPTTTTSCFPAPRSGACLATTRRFPTRAAPAATSASSLGCARASSRPPRWPRRISSPRDSGVRTRTTIPPPAST